MRDNDRNPWQGLTTAQIHELDATMLLPQRRGVDRVEAWGDVAAEYARRCAALLVNNDLRGALNAAEISTAAQHMQDQERFRAHNAQEQIIAGQQRQLQYDEARRARASELARERRARKAKAKAADKSS